MVLSTIANLLTSNALSLKMRTLLWASNKSFYFAFNGFPVASRFGCP
jgi:hypothetical protein